MNIMELLIIAVGLAMDAFAVAVCTGLTFQRSVGRKAFIVGLYFGVFQGGMPLIGYLLGIRFADRIKAFDHWIAFALLVFIGAKMIGEVFAKDKQGDKPAAAEIAGAAGVQDSSDEKIAAGAQNSGDEKVAAGVQGSGDEKIAAGAQNSEDELAAVKEAMLTPAKMLPLALATSIDALAVGVSFAFLEVQIIPAVLAIGIVTLVLSMAGVKIGNVFGTRFKTKAEFAGGVILVLMGLKILLEHLEIVSF